MPPISEPTTMVTDFMITILSVAIAVRLARRSHGTELWILAFTVTGLAALAGGSAHGFKLWLSEPQWRLLWAVTILFIGASAGLLIAAGLRSARRPGTDRLEARRAGYRWLKWAVAVTLVALLLLATGVRFHQHFNQNDMYHLVQMVGLYCLYRGAYRLHPRPGS